MSLGSPETTAASGVLLLDDDFDMLDALSDIIHISSGKTCLPVISYAALLEKRDSALLCKVAILDINLGPGQPSGVDAYKWLRSARFPGRIAFLTGHARNHPLVQEARRLGEARVVQKPVDVNTLLEIVES